MKGWKNIVLLSLVFFLAFACAPQLSRYPFPDSFKAQTNSEIIPEKLLQPANSGGNYEPNNSGFRATVPVAEIASKTADAANTSQLLVSNAAENSWVVFHKNAPAYLKVIPQNALSAKPEITKNELAKKEIKSSVASLKNSEKNPEKRQNNFGLWFGLSALLSAGLLRTNLKKAKQISEWAAQNKTRSRILIGLINGVAIAGALAAGNYFAQQGIGISKMAIDLGAVISGASYVLYPIRNSEAWLFKGSYFRRKLHEIALFAAGIFMMFAAGNQFDLTTKPTPANQQIFSFSTFSVKNPTVSFVKKTAISKADNPDEEKPPKEKNTVAKIALIALLIVLFSLATILLAVLACNLACSGFGAAAVVVFFGGEALAAFFLVHFLQKIFREDKKSKAEKAKAAMQQP